MLSVFSPCLSAGLAAAVAAGLRDWKGTCPWSPTGSGLGHFSVRESPLCPGQSPPNESCPFLSHMVLQYFLFRLCPWLRGAKGSPAGTAVPWH